MTDHLREGHQDEDGPTAVLSEPSAVDLHCSTTDLGAKLVDEEVDVVT